MFEFQVIINGLLLGGLYALMAIGMSLIWGVTNVVNLAHGALIMLGAYATFWLFKLLNIDPFVSLAISFTALFVFGFLVQKYIINFVIRAKMFITLLLTFGLDILITNIAQTAWTSNFRQTSPAYSANGFSFGFITVPYVRLSAFIISIILVFALYIFLKKTKTGQAIRAVSQDIDAARLMGINVAKTFALTFAIGSGLAGVAGSMIGVLMPITPQMGGIFTLKSFVVALVGGLGTIFGPLVGGLFLGLAETLGSFHLGAKYADIIVFGILVLTLIMKPTGILGKNNE